MPFIHQPCNDYNCPTCNKKDNMTEEINKYIQGLEEDRKKLLDFRNFIKSELAFEKQPKLTKQIKSEKINFLEKVLKIIED